MPFKTNSLTKSSYIAFVLLLLGYTVFAQRDVSGKVVNVTENQPIAGATIQVKGTQTLTQSQVDGRFSIRVPNDNSTLIITVVGFDVTEIAVAGRSNIGDVSLSPTSASLNEVVVTGYTTQRKKDITGSVAVVNGNRTIVIAEYFAF